MSNQTGSLVFVGTGILLGGHITSRARNYIENADIVFMSVSSGIMETWIGEMNSDVRSLQTHYQEGIPRTETYKAMISAILHELELGKNVCCALYGHPGIFAYVSHKAIELARNKGYPAHMEPGISAEDCLVADLGIDPGKYGCQQYEATQFMMYQRTIDNSAYLILWQIGVAGDVTLKNFASKEAHKKILVELLSKSYPLDHEIIIYEAKSLPIDDVRIETIKLSELPEASFKDFSTLVVPPFRELELNTRVNRRLSEISI